MRKIFIVSLFYTTSLFSDFYSLDPFLTDDFDNQRRRVNVIEDCIKRIEKKMKKNPELREIRREIEMIKFCLGYEVEIEDIHALYSGDEFEGDMRRRLHYILNHKYERCFERLKNEWMPRLAQRMPSIPTDPDALAELIFSQPDYQDRKSRETASK